MRKTPKMKQIERVFQKDIKTLLYELRCKEGYSIPEIANILTRQGEKVCYTTTYKWITRFKIPKPSPQNKTTAKMVEVKNRLQVSNLKEFIMDGYNNQLSCAEIGNFAVNAVHDDTIGRWINQWGGTMRTAAQTNKMPRKRRKVSQGLQKFYALNPEIAETNGFLMRAAKEKKYALDKLVLDNIWQRFNDKRPEINLAFIQAKPYSLPLNYQEEKTVVGLAKKGNKRARQILFEAHLDMVVKLTLKFSADSPKIDINDFMSDASCKLFEMVENIAKFKGKSRISTFFYRGLSNALYDVGRQYGMIWRKFAYNNEKIILKDFPADNNPIEEVMYRELEERLEEAIQAIPSEKDREAFILCQKEGWRLTKAAQGLGIAYETARSRYRRGNAFVKDYLQDFR